ncbi:MAG TPA: glycosyltransferase [Anaerolineaceae bacterium]|nr:glycosyltransferase [Anaerolineaceae bacterium]
MKIACIATSQIPSSTANSIQVMKVCQALQQEGGDVCLWVPGETETPWTELAAQYGLRAPFDIRWLKTNRSLRRYDLIWKAYRQASQWGADLIYTWLPQAATLALRDQRKAVLEVHDRPTGQVGPFWYRLYFRQPGQKRTLVVSQALGRILAQSYGLPAGEDLQVAPNGADLERYQELPDPAAARRLLDLPDRLTAVYTGHFYAGRGVDILLGLAEAFPHIQVLLVGGKPDAVATVRQQAAGRGLQNVCLTGFVDNHRLPLYQAAGDVLLMPYDRSIAGSSGGNSADICSPMKMFEYMAAGRAILSSDLPVIREVLNAANAAFATPEDLPSWITAFDRLVADRDLRQRLGAQAQADVQPYTWRKRASRALNGL